jgi:hypothetical protein
MNAPESAVSLPAIGSPVPGGFFAGAFRLNGVCYGLAIAPKAQGRHDDAPWNDNWDRVAGAESLNDGLANTEAMAAAGSKVAQWARAQIIDGHSDWYIPAQDELELLYRNLKPTASENYLYGRSGVNVSATPPTYPYAADQPTQTPLALFQEGGAEALDPVWYWSSTQHAGLDDCGWCQYFGDGYQDGLRKDGQFRVVLVRRFPL